MNTESPSTPSDPIKAAREGFFDAIVVLERAQFNAGYDAGFNAGWDAAMRRFAEAVKQHAEQPSDPAPPPPAAATTSMPIQFAVVGEQANASDIVLSAIKGRPGLRGYEIVVLLEGSQHPIPERTVRTCLHRLKSGPDPKIKIVDGRWYAAEAAPADPQLELKE